MLSFGRKIATLRKSKKLSQSELAKGLGSSISVISRYERDEMTPSIDVAKRLAAILDTSVGYLLGESEDDELLKQPEMVDRLKQLNSLDQDSRNFITRALDAMLRDAQTRKAYS